MTITLSDGRSNLYQWDTGRTVVLDFDAAQCHFEGKAYGRTVDVDVKGKTAIIPDVLLQKSGKLRVFAFVGTPDEGYTKIEKTFDVVPRNKPSDYVFTPTEQITLETAVTTANEAKATAETAVTTAIEAKANAGFAVTTANDAKATAETAVTTANDAKATAETAVTTANEAAETAVATAIEAKANAGFAVTTANEAKSNAETAVTTANEAKSNAETAVTTANDAIVTADSVRADADAGKFNGAKGDKGEKGDKGDTGAKGDKGDKGDPGAAGKSAYASAQDGGFTGTEAQFNKGLSIMGDVSGIDTTVTQNSGNLITSGAVYEYTTSAINRVRHYGARWNKTQAQMTRLYDAESFPTDITNFAHRGSVNPNYNNPFDKIYPWSGRKLCNIDIDAYRALTPGQSITRAVKAWEGDTDFSYTDVNGVWVYTPEFWGKSWDETVGSTEYRYFDVADKPCGGYVHYQERIEGRWHGRTQTVNIGGTDQTCLIPSVGMPASRIAMSTLHTYAKNWGATLDSIFSIDANDLLMIVEYATMNSQSAIGSGVDSMYRQSSDLISAAATESTVVKVSKSAGSAFCIPGAIFDIGTTNGGTEVGSFLVVSAVTDPDDSTLLDVTLNAPVTVTTSNYWSVHGIGNAADAEIGSQSGYIGTNGKSIAYYRGEELFGNMFFYILGAYRQTGTQHVFIAHDDNEADAADALNASLHIDTGIALSTTEGYVKKLGILSRSGLLCCPPFCTEKGGDSANPVGDYYYINASAGNTVLIRGGHASYGAYGGAFYGIWDRAASGSYWLCAARPRLKNP